MSLSIDVCLPSELDESSISLWREFQRSHSELANPFLSPEFTVLYGRRRPQARVAVIKDAGQVVGFFPHERHRFGVGRGLGYGITDAQGVIHRPGIEWSSHDLVAACGLGVFEFDHLVGYQGQQIEKNVVLAPSPVVDVSVGCWDSWLDAKRSSNWKRINTGLQKSRKMGREVGELRFEQHTMDPRVLETLMSWKSAQYRRTSRPDRFAKSWMRQLVQDVALTQGEHFSSQLSVLYAGDRLVHVDLSLQANGILAGWFPAYDVDLSHYSPGFVGMLELVKSATLDERITQLDMGKGEAPYKESLKSSEHMVAEGFVQRPSMQAAVWRATTEPRRRALSFVLGNPQLRLAARKTLNHLGRARTAITS